MSRETIAAAPANFRFARHAPGSKLIEKSAAVVFHGGNGTMYQALAGGVPMLALPSHLEQQVSIAAGLREGFARQANCRRITGEKLLNEIERLIHEPSYKFNAMRFRQAVRSTRAPEIAAELLEKHVLGDTALRAAATR